MFETGPGNARLMDLFARSVARPSANSVSYEVYKLLTNDTDFSVFRKHGVSGFNFAFSNSASLYHSARDNLHNLDPRTLRHMGESAFEVTSALADVDLATLNATSDAGFFDVFGLFIVRLAGRDQRADRNRRSAGAHWTDRRASRRLHAARGRPVRGGLHCGSRAVVRARVAAVVSAGRLARGASARSSAALARSRRARDDRHLRPVVHRRRPRSSASTRALSCW